MRLLVVMTSYPFPPQAGSAIIAYNNIREISKKYSVYFICLDNPKKLGDFAEFAEQIEFVRPEKVSRFTKLCRGVFYMLLGIPAFVTEHMSRQMQKRVAELIERDKFDAILLYEIAAVQYCPPVCYKKMLVSIEDPPSIKTRRMKDLSVYSLWKKTKLLVHAKLTEHYENGIIPKVAKVLLLSEEDAKEMREKGYDNIGCVPYGVARRPAEEIVGCEGRTEGMIVFSGSMFHPPNVDGALFFLRHIFPLVLQEYSTAVLWIVGAEPDTRIRDAAACFGEHVVITGRVNDIQEYLRRAKVSICPVRLKIGVQTKILEALSWGTPVVTTSAGNSGIGGCSGSELWVEDEPNIFASRVVSLLRGEGWNQLSEKGRKLAENGFSWERSAMAIEQHIRRIQIASDGG
jgi:glycosyltransferase involved in cell wall biosynthesis